MAAAVPHDDALSVAFPLPYRVLALIAVGLLAWATNLHGLYKLEVDVVAALDLRTDGYPGPVRLPMANHRRPSFIGNGHPTRSGSYMATPHVYQAVYRAFVVYSGICLLSWTLYRLASRGDPALADTYGYIPALTAAFMVVALISPYKHFFKDERERFTHAIRRCFVSSTNTPILFSDVILADIGTSFAKVIGDVWLSLCMIIPGNSMLNPPPQTGLARWVLPTFMSLPYFARFRQCVIEYNLPSNESSRPLFNAIKYATAFPVIYLSAAQGLIVVDDPSAPEYDSPWHGENTIFRLWLLAVFVNSLYSFWWDTTNDWGLELLKLDSSPSQAQQLPKGLVLPRLRIPRRRSKTPLIDRSSSGSSTESTFHSIPKSPPLTAADERAGPYALRPILLFPLAIYPLSILINFMLRMAWTVKLATHLHATRDGSITIFGLELAEIVRRWLWVFIRVEWEVIKKITEEETKEEPDLIEYSSSSRASFESEGGSVSPPVNLMD